jgi:hypothetical protein
MKDKIQALQKFGLSIETDALVLTRNEFACICPMANRVMVPGPIQGQPQLNPGLCTSNCVSFELLAPSHKQPNDLFLFRCEALSTNHLIDPANIKDNSNPSKISKL